MADLVASTVQQLGERFKFVNYTNLSDGTGEAAVIKQARASLTGIGSGTIKIHRVWAQTAGMAVQILFDHTTDQPVLVIPADNYVELDFRDFGGLRDPAGAGGLGDLLFTTVGHTNGDFYSVVLELRW